MTWFLETRPAFTRESVGLHRSTRQSRSSFGIRGARGTASSSSSSSRPRRRSLLFTVMRWCARGRTSGVEVQQDFFGIYDFRDGLLVRFREVETERTPSNPPGVGVGVGDYPLCRPRQGRAAGRGHPHGCNGRRRRTIVWPSSCGRGRFCSNDPLLVVERARYDLAPGRLEDRSASPSEGFLVLRQRNREVVGERRPGMYWGTETTKAPDSIAMWRIVASQPSESSAVGATQI